MNEPPSDTGPGQEAKYHGDSPSQVTAVIRRPGKRETLRVRRARIEVVKGEDQGQSKDVTLQHAVVGTSPRCDLILHDTSVSRRHFELVPGDDSFVLHDLDSLNGTLVRGLSVSRVKLTGSEEIQVGRTVLLFSLTEEHDEHPLSDRTSFGTLAGRSALMRQVFAVLERVAPTDTTVLLEGESGTGKEAAAENIHAGSPFRKAPFVVVDCGAVAPNLIESELFGHVKGAFTGAERDRPGAFEAARGGTVLLDEIGELPLALQPRLLRVLDKGEAKRVGEDHYRPVRVRIIAATNRDLTNEVREGRFREDLFYRLSVVRVRLPPLRERREDIGMLAREFLHRRQPEMDPGEVFSEQVMAMFLNHDWPGNVRELRNVVERLLLFPDKPGSAIQQIREGEDFGPIPSGFLGMNFREFQDRVQVHFEKAYLTAMLDACDGVISRAASMAGIPRQSFYRLMHKYGLTR